MLLTDAEGGVNVTDCKPCTPGYYCEQYGLAAPNGPCHAGYYCPGGQYAARPVEYACSPGHFCLEGSWNETGCPSGTYQPHWKQSDCDVCPAGSYCKAFGKHYWWLLFSCRCCHIFADVSSFTGCKL